MPVRTNIYAAPCVDMPRFGHVYRDEQLALAGYYEDKPTEWRYYWVDKNQCEFSTDQYMAKGIAAVVERDA